MLFLLLQNHGALSCMCSTRLSLLNTINTRQVGQGGLQYAAPDSGFCTNCAHGVTAYHVEIYILPKLGVGYAQGAWHTGFWTSQLKCTDRSISGHAWAIYGSVPLSARLASVVHEGHGLTSPL